MSDLFQPVLLHNPNYYVVAHLKFQKPSNYYKFLGMPPNKQTLT